MAAMLGSIEVTASWPGNHLAFGRAIENAGEWMTPRETFEAGSPLQRPGRTASLSRRVWYVERGRVGCEPEVMVSSCQSFTSRKAPSDVGKVKRHNHKVGTGRSTRSARSLIALLVSVN